MARKIEFKTWRTEIYASDPVTRQLRIFPGPEVPGNDIASAQAYCAKHCPYAKVIEVLKTHGDKTSQILEFKLHGRDN